MFFTRTAVVLLFVFSSVSCGRERSDSSQRSLPPLPPDSPDYVVRAKAVLPVTFGEGQALTASQGVPVTVTLAANTVMALDLSKWTPPAAPEPFKVNAFGNLELSTLRDNKLNVCGANGNQKCTKALIRIYTTDKPGPGLWNDAEGYGAPLATGATPIGLTAANAAVVQQTAIAANQHVLMLTNFPNASYPVSADFAGAGAGSYAATMVVEYVLAP